MNFASLLISLTNTWRLEGKDLERNIIPLNTGYLWKGGGVLRVFESLTCYSSVSSRTHVRLAEREDRRKFGFLYYRWCAKHHHKLSRGEGEGAVSILSSRDHTPTTHMLFRNLNTPAFLPPSPPPLLPPPAPPPLYAGQTRWSALVLAPSKGFLRPNTPRGASGYKEPWKLLRLPYSTHPWNWNYAPMQ